MLNKKTHVHFIGIGGIGMSGIALVLQKQGYLVSGCDTNMDQKSIHDLKKNGCKISSKHDGPICKNNSINFVVYSSAVSQTNPELIRAKKKNVTLVHRSEMLAFLMQKKQSIAITGSHGKTTTSSIISDLLLKANYDPTIVVGGHLDSIKSNAQFGNSEWFVAEADESDRSLLKLFPTIAVLTSIDFDHAETYKNLEDVKQTFRQFLQKVPFYGAAIVCVDDDNIKTILPIKNIKTVTYGTSPKADFRIIQEQLDSNGSKFSIQHYNKQYGPITLSVAGHHNVLNATAAFATATLIGIAPEKSIKALSKFTGVDRRFTFKGLYNGARIIDDYGHHPAEIACTLEVARQQTAGKLHVIFQPHRYTRTKHLWQDFLNCFLKSKLDTLIITDIYPASENPLKGISSKIFVQSLKKVNPKFKVTYIPLDTDFKTLLTYISPILKNGDCLLLQGAGKINKLADKLTIKNSP